MKILMPFPNFEKSAASLDDKTLITQFWLIHSLLLAFWDKAAVPEPCEGWRDYDNALCVYGVTISRELIQRGSQSASSELLQPYLCAKNNNMQCPPWFGDTEIHAYDRALLLKQNPGHYKKFYWRVQNV